MADEKSELEEAAESKQDGNGKRLMGILLTALIAGAAGAGGSIAVQSTSLMSKLGAGDDVEQEAEGADAGGVGAEGSPADAESAADFQERLLTLEPVVMNIEGDGVGRFLKVTVGLETDAVSTREDLAQRVPQLTDAIITLMSSKRVVEITDFEGKAILKEDLRERVNQLLPMGSVESVLFTEFVIQ